MVFQIDYFLMKKRKYVSMKYLLLPTTKFSIENKMAKLAIGRIVKKKFHHCSAAIYVSKYEALKIRNKINNRGVAPIAFCYTDKSMMTFKLSREC